MRPAAPPASTEAAILGVIDARSRLKRRGTRYTHLRFHIDRSVGDAEIHFALAALLAAGRLEVGFFDRSTYIRTRKAVGR